VKETAQYLGFFAKTIYNGLSRGSKNPFPVKPKRVGRHVRFDIEALNKHIEEILKAGGKRQALVNTGI
jgi:predicted DNA-binding transcriptional regulator AlpA